MPRRHAVAMPRRSRCRRASDCRAAIRTTGHRARRRSPPRCRPRSARDRRASGPETPWRVPTAGDHATRRESRGTSGPQRWRCSWRRPRQHFGSRAQTRPPPSRRAARARHRRPRPPSCDRSPSSDRASPAALSRRTRQPIPACRASGRHSRYPRRPCRRPIRTESASCRRRPPWHPGSAGRARCSPPGSRIADQRATRRAVPPPRWCVRAPRRWRSRANRR